MTDAYDLIAIGSGPAGQNAALAAARLGKRAALVERDGVLGGVSTNRGTLPSKTLRVAIVELAGHARGIYGGIRRVKDGITLDDLVWRAQQVIENERAAIQDELRRNRVDVIPGAAAFADPHVLVVQTRDGSRHVRAETIVIAVGAKPDRPLAIDFDDRVVLDSDGILRQGEIPRQLVVVGGSAIGLEYASMAVALGVQVTVAEKRPRFLEFVDDEIVESLEYYLRGLGVTFRLEQEVEAVHRQDGGAMLHLLGGIRLPAECVLYAAGRRGATDDLDLPAAGLEADDRGRIHVGPDYRTAQTHIFAAGDVVGFPALAATAMAQGSVAALAALGGPPRAPAPYPHAIYTIPEIAFVGLNERELDQNGTPYVVGRARYRQLARSDLAGVRCGLLKLLVHGETRHLLGAHIFGASATELVHLGQAAIAAGLTVDYFAEAVLNVPTFSEAYKIAALEASKRLS